MKLIKLKIMYGQGTCPMAVQWSFIGQPKIRNLLIYGEPAGARTREARRKGVGSLFSCCSRPPAGP